MTDLSRYGGWMDRAACAGEKGFTERPIADQLARCDGCPVRAECLDLFLAGPTKWAMVSQWGFVAGGLTPGELHDLVRTRERSTGRAPTRLFVLSGAGRRNRAAGQREARACRA